MNNIIDIHVEKVKKLLTADVTAMLDNISKEHQKTIEASIGLTGKVALVKSANKMGQVMSAIVSYKSSIIGNNHYRNENSITIDELCDYATKHANQLYKESKEIHEANIPILESNDKIRKAVIKIMTDIGIGTSYVTYSFKTARSSKKTEERHNSGWYDDLNRTAPISDGFTEATSAYNKRLYDIDAYRTTQKRKLEEDTKKKEDELRGQKDTAEAILYLTEQKLVAGEDYKIEDAVKLATEMRLPEIEYMNIHQCDIIFGDHEDYEVKDTELSSEWRHGVVKYTIVKSRKTGKYYGISWRSGGDCGYEDNNYGNTFTEISNADLQAHL